MVYRRQRSIYEIPYFRALAIWNQSKSPLKDKAWVIPLGPKRIPPDGSIYHQEIQKIREGQNSSSSSSPMPPPPPPPPTPPPSSSTTKQTPLRTSSTPVSSPRYEYNPDVQEFPDVPELKKPGPLELGSVFPEEQPGYTIEKQIEIKPSTIVKAGDGVFTKIALKKNQAIGIYTGTIVTQAQAELSNKSIELKVPKTIFVDGKKKGNWTSKLNHPTGVRANVKFLQNGKIITTRSVKPGEELFVNYGPYAQEILERKSQSTSEKRKTPSSVPSPTHMLYNRQDHITYVREGSSEGKKYKYFYELKLNQDKPLQAPTFKAPLDTLELGAGAYGSVYVGELNNKKVAVKFQILDAPIPKSNCAKQSEVKECRKMTRGEWLKEIQYISYASAALGNACPQILGVNTWDVVNVTVEPSIPPGERLKLPNTIGSLTMDFFQGNELYEVKDGYDEEEQVRITDIILFFMKLLYEYKYDKYNPDKHLKWYDLHFGNILITQPGDSVKFIDLGMLEETTDDWETVEKFYVDRINEEWESI